MADEPPPEAAEEQPVEATPAPAAEDKKGKKGKKEKAPKAPKPEKPPPAWMIDTKPWASTLFGCCSGPDAGNAICVVAYCPGCSCLAGEAATVSELGNWYACCLGHFFFPCCAQAMLRNKVVTTYKMQEPTYKTFCIACCCCPCSGVQTNSQIMIETEKQFSDIIASTKLYNRPAGLEGAQKLRPSMLEDPRRAVSRWRKMDQLEAPLNKLMDREYRVDAQEDVVRSTVAKLTVEVVYESWMAYELDRHSQALLDIIMEEEIDQLGEALAVEARLEGVATAFATASDDIEKKAKKAERTGKLAKDSGDKDKMGLKKFEATKKEVADEESEFESNMAQYKKDIAEASSESVKAKAEISLSKAEAKAEPEKKDREERLAAATAEYKKVNDQATTDAAEAAEAKEASDNAAGVRDAAEAENNRVKAEEDERLAAKPEADKTRDAEMKAARAERKAQSDAAGRVWAVDLEAVMKRADDSVPLPKRKDVTAGLDVRGIQQNIDDNRGLFKKGKKKASGGGGGAAFALDPEDVPEEWKKAIPLDPKYDIANVKKS